MKLNELGLGIDALYALREKRLDIEKQVKEMKQQEYQLRNEILLVLGESGLAKASGQMATASVRVSTIPIVEDWESVYAYIVDNDRFDLLQKRLSTVAWRDLAESGTLVPGTASVEDTDISLTKSTRGI
jgi:hypothetical protein